MRQSINQGYSSTSYTSLFSPSWIMRLKIPEVPNPPPYSNLSSPTSTPTHDRKFVEIPLHEHAPYPVDSCRNLGKAENAIPDEDEFNANLGVLHRNDFEKTKRYEGKTMVQIQEVGSRKYRVSTRERRRVSFSLQYVSMTFFARLTTLLSTPTTPCTLSTF